MGASHSVKLELFNRGGNGRLCGQRQGPHGGDAVILRKGIGTKLMHSVRTPEKQGPLVLEGKRKRASVWAVPSKCKERPPTETISNPRYGPQTPS